VADPPEPLRLFDRQAWTLSPTETAGNAFQDGTDRPACRTEATYRRSTAGRRWGSQAGDDPEPRSRWPSDSDTHITGGYTRSVSRSAPGLLPIFRSDNQLRLLGQLFLHPDHEQTIAELEAATSIPQQTVSREIDRLVQAGLLEDRRQGRMHFVRPDPANPYFPELSGLLLKALGPRSVLAERLDGIAGVDAAYLFGSWARRYEGEPGPPPGDIDVVIVGEPDVDEVYEACRQAGATLGQEVNPVILTPAEWKGRRSGFVRQVRSGPLVPIPFS
jgi:DNA-binding transcriptional ArsR family regulator